MVLMPPFQAVLVHRSLVKLTVLQRDTTYYSIRGGGRKEEEAGGVFVHDR